jgi:hypothetical protein
MNITERTLENTSLNFIELLDGRKIEAFPKAIQAEDAKPEIPNDEVLRYLKCYYGVVKKMIKQPNFFVLFEYPLM